MPARGSPSLNSNNTLMRKHSVTAGRRRPAGFLRLAAVLLGAALPVAALPVAASAAVPGPDYAADHTAALASLTDIKAAISTIMAAENSMASGPNAFKAAAQSAINALVGAKDKAYDSNVNNPGDRDGVIGHVGHLLDRRANPPWVPALHGVLVNATAAVAHLQDALHAKSLGHYQVDASKALADLEIAQGRTSQYDVLGGMSGAIANTALGVPAKSAIENACAAPSRAGIGVHRGYIAWRAVALADLGKGMRNPGGTTIDRTGDLVVFETAAKPEVDRLCAREAAKTSGSAQAPAHVVRTAATSGGTAGDAPALYTESQAVAGKAVYEKNCTTCHGDHLQGVSAPAIAGHDFLKTSKTNKWTVSILRTIVVQNMPFNNPGALSPKQYADVMAFLLASNCYPAGSTPFPEKDEPAFGKIVVGPLAQPAGTPDKNGVCSVGG